MHFWQLRGGLELSSLNCALAASRTQAPQECHSWEAVKQWCFAAANGKLIVNVCYGTCLIELAKGKTAVEVASTADLVPTLELIKQAVEAGELDAQMDAASVKLREGFGG